MSHPDNLSDEYPCQGDTWSVREGTYDVLSVLSVTPAGEIRYVLRDLGRWRYVLTAKLEEFQTLLKSLALTVPSYCTDKYFKIYGHLKAVE